MISAVLVGVGGAAGALARYAVDSALGGRRGTVAVNVLGSVALGALTTAPIADSVALLAGVGFCGAFTTFSSFAVAIVEDVEAGRPRRAALYAAGTLGAAIAGVVLGGWLAASG